jgi:hypothetical protein
MKASELRLGNWVHPKFPMQVVSIYKDEILCDFEGNEGDPWEFNPKELDGITLTEEWVKKIGFQKHHNSYQFGNIMYELTFKSWSFFGISIDKQFKYVHEIQNLVHALTGKEL